MFSLLNSFFNNLSSYLFNWTCLVMLLWYIIPSTLFSFSKACWLRKCRDFLNSLGDAKVFLGMVDFKTIFLPLTLKTKALVLPNYILHWNHNAKANLGWDVQHPLIRHHTKSCHYTWWVEWELHTFRLYRYRYCDLTYSSNFVR